MPEEKAVKDPDVSPDEDLGEDTGLETDDLNEGAPDDGDVGDVDDGQGADEEVDDRGVSWKNVVAELNRKLSESTVRETSLTEILKEKTKSKETERGNIPDMLESISDAEFDVAGFTKQHADIVRKSQQREIDRFYQKKLKEADKERADLQKLRQEAEDLRVKSIHEIQDEFGDGEFGGLIYKDPKDVWQWDEKSELWKRTAEIFNSTPALRQRPDGQAVAARKALVELTREKYGKPPDKKDTKLNKSQRMLGGKGGRGGGKTGAVMNSEGEFYRKLSIAEYDQLSREDKDRYGVWETLKRTE